MSENEIEMATLLARFKLKVRRDLGLSVDLSAMSADKAYAEKSLKEVEELAEDEDLLVMVIRLRHLLGQGGAKAGDSQAQNGGRSYQFGARSW